HAVLRRPGGGVLRQALAARADVEQASLEHVGLALADGLALPDVLDRRGEHVGGLGAALVVGAAAHHVPIPLDDELVIRRGTVSVLYLHHVVLADHVAPGMAALPD